MAKMTPKMKAEVWKETAKSVSNAVGSMKNDFTNLFQTIGRFSMQQISEPIEGVRGLVQQLADIDLSNLTRFSSILKEIGSITKSLATEQVSWEQQLISIYKNVADVAKGSAHIYSMMAKTHRITQDTILEWNKWGGYAEGVRLAVEFSAHSTNQMNQLSNSLLLTWYKQNKAMGISQEDSAKMVGLMSRAGISVREAVNFQGKLNSIIKNTYKDQVLSSKIMTKITSSNLATLLYTEKNLDYLSRIAVQAHEWNVEIDDIWQTSLKLAKAEDAIETARKFQLAFGIQLNARQMQYNAQTGKHVENVQTILSSLKMQGIEYDNLVYAQQKIIADAIAGGDLAKAKIMLLGKEKEMAEAAVDPQTKMVDALGSQSKLLNAMYDRLANWSTMFTLIRTGLWNAWKKDLDFIFGKQANINSAEQLTLALEKERVRLLSQLFMPFLERFAQKSKELNMPLLGQGSLIEKFAGLFKVIGDRVADVGLALYDWFIRNKVLDRITDKLASLNLQPIIDGLIRFGNALVKMIMDLDPQKFIDTVGKLIGFFETLFKWIGWVINAVLTLGPVGTIVVGGLIKLIGSLIFNMIVLRLAFGNLGKGTISTFGNLRKGITSIFGNIGRMMVSIFKNAKFTIFQLFHGMRGIGNMGNILKGVFSASGGGLGGVFSAFGFAIKKIIFPLLVVYNLIRWIIDMWKIWSSDASFGTKIADSFKSLGNRALDAVGVGAFVPDMQLKSLEENRTLDAVGAGAIVPDMQLKPLEENWDMSSNTMSETRSAVVKLDPESAQMVAEAFVKAVFKTRGEAKRSGVGIPTIALYTPLLS